MIVIIVPDPEDIEVIINQLFKDCQTKTRTDIKIC